MRYLFWIGLGLSILTAFSTAQAPPAPPPAAPPPAAAPAPAPAAAAPAAPAPAPAPPGKYKIPPDKIESQKVFFGSPAGFDKAGKVDYDTVIKATPEYEEVRKKKIEPGTGKYWILLSQASERAKRSISDVGHESGFGLVAATVFLSKFEPGIPSEDITETVIKQMKDGKKSTSEKPADGEKTPSKEKDSEKKAEEAKAPAAPAPTPPAPPAGK